MDNTASVSEPVLGRPGERGRIVVWIVLIQNADCRAKGERLVFRTSWGASWDIPVIGLVEDLTVYSKWFGTPGTEIDNASVGQSRTWKTSQD